MKNFFKIALGLLGKSWGPAMVPTHTSASTAVNHSITASPHCQGQAQGTREAWLAEGLQIRCWNTTPALSISSSCTRGLSALPRTLWKWKVAESSEGFWERQKEGQQHFKVPRAWLIPRMFKHFQKVPKGSSSVQQECWTTAERSWN